MVRKISGNENTENINDLLTPDEMKTLTGNKNHNKKNKNKNRNKENVANEKVTTKPSAPINIKKNLKKTAETFSDFLAQEEYAEANKELIEQEEREEEELRNKLSQSEGLKSVLNKATITDLSDLGSITIVDSERTPNQTMDEDLKFLLNSKPTYQVVLNQSAYVAHMEGLKFKDIFSLANSTGDVYSSHLRRYQTYHSAINSTSIGYLTFEEFSKYTSLYDIPTIEFGIFNQTFPGDTKFNIKCHHCKKTMENVKIPNDQLIVARNDEAYEQLDRVIHSIHDRRAAGEYSLINKTDRFQLPVSKAIVDIRIPTIKDQLDILVQVKDLKAVSEYLDILYFIKDVMVVNLIETEKQGKPIFTKLTDRNQVLLFLKNMELDDVAKLNKEVEGKDTKYRVDYKIKSFKCQNIECGKDTGDIDIDIQTLLFDQAVTKVL